LKETREALDERQNEVESLQHRLATASSAQQPITDTSAFRKGLPFIFNLQFLRFYITDALKPSSKREGLKKSVEALDSDVGWWFYTVKKALDDIRAGNIDASKTGLEELYQELGEKRMGIQVIIDNL
jgi:hypothetical protein